MAERCEHEFGEIKRQAVVMKTPSVGWSEWATTTAPKIDHYKIEREPCALCGLTIDPIVIRRDPYMQPRRGDSFIKTSDNVKVIMVVGSVQVDALSVCWFRFEDQGLPTAEVEELSWRDWRDWVWDSNTQIAGFAEEPAWVSYEI